MLKCNKFIGALHLTFRSTGLSASCAGRHPVSFGVRRQREMATRTPIGIADLEAALAWSSAGSPFENQAFIGRLTGEVHLQSLHGDFGEELPEDIEDGTRFIAMQHKNDLDLGRELVFEFVSAEAPQLEAQVRVAFRQKGAYGKFKAILERTRLLERWYEFERIATKAALVRWAEDNGFEVGGKNDA